MPEYEYNQSGQPSAEYFRMVHRVERAWSLNRHPGMPMIPNEQYDIVAEAERIARKKMFVDNMNA